MSPWAAWRLEGYGFERVYDYVPGKATWFADTLPKESKLAGVPTIGDVARRDVPTCSPAAKVSMVRESVRKGAWTGAWSRTKSGSCSSCCERGSWSPILSDCGRRNDLGGTCHFTLKRTV